MLWFIPSNFTKIFSRVSEKELKTLPVVADVNSRFVETDSLYVVAVSKRLRVLSVSRVVVVVVGMVVDVSVLQNQNRQLAI